MNDAFEALRRDISDLGRVLGETLREQVGDALYAQEEELRALAKERRRGRRDGDAAARLQAIIATLDAPTVELVARAFTHYFQLANLAEQHHRTRRRRAYARERTAQTGSFAHELVHLTTHVTRAQLDALLARLSNVLVFTAHPSEAQRRTVLGKHRRLAQLLARRERTELTPEERDEITTAITEEVTALWQTDEIRSAKPRVADEVKNTLFYLEEVLFPLVPRFYETFERVVGATFGAGATVPTTLVRFGSWVGADMDGNPNVTPAVAIDTAYAQGLRVTRRYLDALDELGEVLSQSTRRAGCSEALRASLVADAALLDTKAPNADAAMVSEPYRDKLRFMRARLIATRTALTAARRASEPKVAFVTPAYAGPDALLADVRLIADSLLAHGGARAGWRRVRGLERQIETFGFHLARLDVRVPAAWLREQDPRGREALTAVASIRAITAGRGAESFILSMAHGLDDLRATLATAADVGLYRPSEGVAEVSIVPLFETLADLERCPAEIERAAEDPTYAEYLRLRGGRQEIMIGYSDSNKDAGILMSSFALYRAQQRLLEVAARHGLVLEIFHGRGGSIGRGGGPSQRAIESLPHGSIDGRFKITEQGEVLGWKYLLEEIAERNLVQTTSAVLRASLDTATPELGPYEAAFAEVATESVGAYRALIHDPDFIAYYEASTPLDEIARLNIGSRPAHRSGDRERTLDDLRAIPWVFAWTQSRQMVPGWFGAGRALQRLLARRGVAFAQAMVRAWPFFASTLDAVAVALATADLDIAARYAGLVDDPVIARRLFGKIALDLGRAVRAIRRIYGRDGVLPDDSYLTRSIELRNPYVDPLSFMQVELLRRKRKLVAAGEPVPDALERALLLTVNGIAAGLRNTG